MKQLKKYRTALTAVCILILAAVLFPVFSAHATSEPLVTWEDTSKDNEVSVRLSIPGEAGLDEAATMELKFHLESENVEGIKFLFDKKIEKAANISVKEWIYDEENNDLTVFLSGTGALLKKGESLMLGRLQVTSEYEVKISVVKEACGMVDQYHDMEQMAGLGDDNFPSYEMDLRKNEATDSPETAPSQETGQVPETNPEQDATKPQPETTKPQTEGSSSSDREEDPGYSRNWIASGTTWQYKKPDGALAKNEWAMIDGKWYHFNEEGAMQTGWISTNGTWYYLNPSGEMKTGWVWDGSKWYYCGSTGAMKTGWIQDKTVWYHLQPSGAMDTGWVLHDGKWYYMAADGRMMTNTVTPDGYHLDRNGVCVDK